MIPEVFLKFFDSLFVRKIDMVVCDPSVLNVCNLSSFHDQSNFYVFWVLSFALVGFALFVNRRNI